jgi:transposase-like protein
LASVRCDLAQWLAKWQGKYAKLCAWIEDNIEETLTYYRLPLAHPKHMKSTNMLERLNQEIKRRTHVVRIFPDRESCLRLVRIPHHGASTRAQETGFAGLGRLTAAGRARRRAIGGSRQPRPHHLAPRILLNLTHTTL